MDNTFENTNGDWSSLGATDLNLDADLPEVWTQPIQMAAWRNSCSCVGQFHAIEQMRTQLTRLSNHCHHITAELTNISADLRRLKSDGDDLRQYLDESIAYQMELRNAIKQSLEQVNPNLNITTPLTGHFPGSHSQPPQTPPKILASQSASSKPIGSERRGLPRQPETRSKEPLRY